MFHWLFFCTEICKEREREREDPDSFVRDGHTLITFFLFLLMRGYKYHYKRADDCPTLNTGFVVCDFKVIRTCIAKKPYIL